MHTFIELPIFTRCAVDYFDDGELAELQKALAKNPESGAVVPGTHGVRKLCVNRGRTTD